MDTPVSHTLLSPSKSDAARDQLVDAVRGCTFDDFLFAPQFSVLERRDPATIDLTCRLSEHLTLRRPIVSANMDTVTRAPMAIVQAEEGGIGIIDRGFKPGDIEPQVREVEIVKRTQHGVIVDPYTIPIAATLAEAAAAMRRSRVGTLVVVDGQRALKGLLTERDLRFVTDDGVTSASVETRMTPLEKLVVHQGPISIDDAERLMVARKIKKLPLVDRRGTLVGLITAKDILKQKRQPFATRDAQGRLRVGAAIGAKGDYVERAAELVRVGVDVLVVDIAHGHSLVMARAIDELRKRFDDVELIAGNVGTAEGARFLSERGVNGIKVGIGPGGGCTTRLTTSFGVPQVQALVECRAAVADAIPLIADGGIKRHGSMTEALLFGGDSVMLGSAFAGTLETPGDIVQKPVLLPESQKVVKVPFKVLRGMASIEAIKDRLDVEEADVLDLQALGAEGLEVSVPVRGSARPIFQDMIKHLCSSVSYGGASSLAELKHLFWTQPDRYLIRLSAAARRESYER
ncbi:MAG: IMP dehydrogenase [Vicinamibacteraceae bacterium]